MLERDALYPIGPGEVAAHFGTWHEGRDAHVWKRLQTRAVALHLWNALTQALPIVCGSLIHRVLEANCVVCVPLPCEDSSYVGPLVW